VLEALTLLLVFLRVASTELRRQGRLADLIRSLKDLRIISQLNRILARARDRQIAFRLRVTHASQPAILRDRRCSGSRDTTLRLELGRRGNGLHPDQLRDIRRHFSRGLDLQDITRDQLQRIARGDSDRLLVRRDVVGSLQPADRLHFFPPVELRVVHRLRLALGGQGEQRRGAVRVHPENHFPKTLRTLIRAEGTGSTKACEIHSHLLLKRKERVKSPRSGAPRSTPSGHPSDFPDQGQSGVRYAPAPPSRQGALTQGWGAAGLRALR